MFQENRKDDVEESWGQYTALFHATVYVECPRHASVILHSTLWPMTLLNCLVLDRVKPVGIRLLSLTPRGQWVKYADISMVTLLCFGCDCKWLQSGEAVTSKLLVSMPLASMPARILLAINLMNLKCSSNHSKLAWLDASSKLWSAEKGH